MLSLVTCTENCLCTVTVDLVFFNESLLLEGQIWIGIIWIIFDRKLGSDENQSGEVINEGVGVFGLVPPSPKI